MKTLKVIPRREEDIDKLITMLNHIDLVGQVEVQEEKGTFRKLTVEDVALGIGRPATDEELADYFNRPQEGEWKPLEKVVGDIKKHLQKERKSAKKIK